LEFQDPSGCGVDGDTIKGFGHSCEDTTHIVVFGLLTQGVKCPSGIFA